MGFFSKFTSDMKSVGKNIGNTFSNAINEGGRVGKKVGKFIKPIAEKVNLAAALINTPWGQAALYGVGSLFGPAGLAAATGISSLSKALYVATAIGLGIDNVKGGLKSITEGDYLSGGLRTGIGLFGGLTGVGRLGKIRVSGLDGSTSGAALRDKFTKIPLNKMIGNKLAPIKDYINKPPPIRPYDMTDYYNVAKPSRFGLIKEGYGAVRNRFGSIWQGGKSTSKFLAGSIGPGEAVEAAEYVEAPNTIFSSGILNTL